ncbi:hypothetical protein [Streptomyces sp. Qhu_M48]|uniref:hypothetical protein n=1 Tax=Streptomyces sp. Qhu_M48 TaxID=3435889 RepID=UPI003F4FEF39
MTHRTPPPTATAPARPTALARPVEPARPTATAPGDAPAPGDEADPRWWVPPLVATVLAPPLSWAAAGAGGMFAAVPVFLISGFVLPFAFVVPSWFLARTRRRRRTRISLATVACAVAAGFPTAVSGVLWTVFIVMLLTGNVRS